MGKSAAEAKRAKAEAEAKKPEQTMAATSNPVSLTVEDVIASERVKIRAELEDEVRAEITEKARHMNAKELLTFDDPKETRLNQAKRVIQFLKDTRVNYSGNTITIPVHLRAEIIDNLRYTNGIKM